MLRLGGGFPRWPQRLPFAHPDPGPRRQPRQPGTSHTPTQTTALSTPTQTRVGVLSALTPNHRDEVLLMSLRPACMLCSRRRVRVRLRAVNPPMPRPGAIDLEATQYLAPLQPLGPLWNRRLLLALATGGLDYNSGLPNELCGDLQSSEMIVVFAALVPRSPRHCFPRVWLDQQQPPSCPGLIANRPPQGPWTRERSVLPGVPERWDSLPPNRQREERPSRML